MEDKSGFLKPLELAFEQGRKWNERRAKAELEGLKKLYMYRELFHGSKKNS